MLEEVSKTGYLPTRRRSFCQASVTVGHGGSKASDPRFCVTKTGWDTSPVNYLKVLIIGIHVDTRFLT